MNVLITYAGGIAGQSIIKSLKNSKYSEKIKIIAIDCDINCPSLKWADVGLICPKSQTVEYELFIKNLLIKENIKLYIPTGEEDLYFISGLKQEYPDICFYVSDKNVIEMCQDKWKFYEHCKSDFDLPYSQLTMPSVPFFEKPRKGRGSVGARLVQTNEEIINKSGMIYQEYLPGKEWTVDVLTNLKGEIINITPRKRILIKSGISTQGTIELNKNIIDKTVKLIKFLNIHGPACVQYKESKDGVLKIVEVNPRFGGGIIFTTLAGVNHTELILDDVLSKEIDINKLIAKEITIARFWSECIL